MQDTIVAIDTPIGRGGIGIIRVSGSLVIKIANIILKQLPKPRYATYSNFCDKNSKLIDQRIDL